MVKGINNQTELKNMKKTKSKSSPEELKEYREYVRKRLSELTPTLQKAAVGDFSLEIEIPGKEDEFSELCVGLNLMMEDLRELDATRRLTEQERGKAEEERKKRLLELEKWRNLTTGREMRMVELKKEITELENKINKLENQS